MAGKLYLTVSYRDRQDVKLSKFGDKNVFWINDNGQVGDVRVSVKKFTFERVSSKPPVKNQYMLVRVALTHLAPITSLNDIYINSISVKKVGANTYRFTVKGYL